MGRPSNRTEKRSQIVAGLTSVLAEHGYARATIVKVAEAAGVAPGLVHYHFTDKAEILRALVEQLARQRDERFEALSKASTDPQQRLDAFIDAHVALGPGSDATAVRAWSLLGAEAQRDPAVKAVYERAMQHSLRTAEGLFREWLRAEARDAKAARTHAVTLLASIEGVFHLATSAPRLVPRGFASPALRHLSEALVFDTRRS